MGVEYLFDLHSQIVIEGAVVERMGDSTLRERNTPSASAISTRSTTPGSSALDAMKGWRQGQKDVYGVRVELRRKF